MKVLLCSDTTDTRSIREVTYLQEINKDISRIRVVEMGYNVEVYNFKLFPLEYKEELYFVVEERARLKKLYDESIALVYQLRNKITTEKNK